MNIDTNALKYPSDSNSYPFRQNFEDYNKNILLNKIEILEKKQEELTKLAEEYKKLCFKIRPIQQSMKNLIENKREFNKRYTTLFRNTLENPEELLQVVKFDLGRRTGHSIFIAHFAKKGDVVFVPYQSHREELKHNGICKNVPIFTDTLYNFNKLPKIFGDIYIENSFLDFAKYLIPNLLPLLSEDSLIIVMQ